jgi:hypothetical protein
LGASVTNRHCDEPRFRLEKAAARIVGIERSGSLGLPRLQRGQDRRQDNKRGAGCADDRPAKRRALPAAFAQAQRHATIPASIAELVIRIGRRRLRAPSIAASHGSRPALYDLTSTYFEISARM